MSYDPGAPRKSVSLLLNEDLVLRAKGLTRDLSETVKPILAPNVRCEQDREQAEDDRPDEVISALNARHERDELLSDDCPAS